jgi:hypothetical protein
MAPKKKIAKKLDLKKVTRLATLGIVVLGTALTGATGWFIMKTLNDTAAVQGGGTNRDFKIEGINVQLLDRLLEAQQKKTATDAEGLPRNLGNPFKQSYSSRVTTSPPAPAPTPAPVAPPPAPSVN